MQTTAALCPLKLPLDVCFPREAPNGKSAVWEISTLAGPLAREFFRRLAAHSAEYVAEFQAGPEAASPVAVNAQALLRCTGGQGQPSAQSRVTAAEMRRTTGPAAIRRRARNNRCSTPCCRA